MTISTAFKIAAGAAMLSICISAYAERRAIRIDGFGDTWTTFDGAAGDPPGIGSANCPGTTAGGLPENTLIQALGHSFSGRELASYLTDDYCQVALPTTLTTQGYTYLDEQGLASLFGDNPGNQISAIRYAMLDQPRFSSPGPSGFQWAFYSFPSGTTLVALYGLDNVVLNSLTNISDGVYAGGNSYSGQYFCFSGNTFIGTWDGDASEYASPCLKAALGRIFADGFEQ
jgi:hypothetical protein